MRSSSFWEVVVVVVGGKEGGVGEAEDVRLCPPQGSLPQELGHTHPSYRVYPIISGDGILTDPPRVVPYILHVIRAQQG